MDPLRSLKSKVNRTEKACMVEWRRWKESGYSRSDSRGQAAYQCLNLLASARGYAVEATGAKYVDYLIIGQSRLAQAQKLLRKARGG